MTVLLPLADSSFEIPTDRDMLPSERREFVRTHRTCVFGTNRRTDGPAMSIVYYVPTAQPPRHLHDNDQAEAITHWISAAMPWGQPDP